MSRIESFCTIGNTLHRQESESFPCSLINSPAKDVITRTGSVIMGSFVGPELFVRMDARTISLAAFVSNYQAIKSLLSNS